MDPVEQKELLEGPLLATPQVSPTKPPQEKITFTERMKGMRAEREKQQQQQQEQEEEEEVRPNPKKKRKTDSSSSLSQEAVGTEKLLDAGMDKILDQHSYHVVVFMLLVQTQATSMEIFGDSVQFRQLVNVFVHDLIQILPQYMDRKRKLGSALQICVHVIGSSKSTAKIEEKFATILGAMPFLQS